MEQFGDLAIMMPSVLQINLTHNSYFSLACNSAGPYLELTAFQWYECENISKCCHGKRKPKEMLVANSEPMLAFSPLESTGELTLMSLFQ